MALLLLVIAAALFIWIVNTPKRIDSTNDEDMLFW
jgi:hypothetical protein